MFWIWTLFWKPVGIGSECGRQCFEPEAYASTNCRLLFLGIARRSECGLRGVVGVVLVRLQLLNDQGNAPVRRIQRIFQIAQSLVGISSNLGYLIPAETVLLHETSRCIGSVGGKFPVPIVPDASVRCR